MKKKRYLMLLVFLSLFFVIGQSCERSGSSKEGVFLGGKEGLVVEFLDDAPPLSGIFQNEAFPIDIEMINKGETDVGAGAAQLYLTGALTSSVVTISPDQNNNDAIVLAAEESDKEKVEDSLVVSMGTATYTGDILGDSVSLDARAAVCYPYQTKVQIEEFCVPSTTRRATGNDDCEIVSTENLIREGDNSGGPVAVTSFREQEGAGFVRITIDINNVGNGDVVNQNSCSDNLQRTDLNKVNVKMPSGPNGFNCSFREGDASEGLVELRNGHAVLRCKRDVTNPGSAFKEPIGITLDYNYWQEISKTVTINKNN